MGGDGWICAKKCWYFLPGRSLGSVKEMRMWVSFSGSCERVLGEKRSEKARRNIRI